MSTFVFAFVMLLNFHFTHYSSPPPPDLNASALSKKIEEEAQWGGRELIPEKEQLFVLLRLLGQVATYQLDS